MATSLEYSVLEVDRTEIRVLELLPGRTSDTIRCKLRTVSLTESPCYGALSYVWGDPKLCSQVEIDGCKCQVTASLAGAMRALRQENRCQIIWADAICINQSDITEKENQVSIMGQIYRKASEVYVWFGELPDNCYQHLLDEGFPEFDLSDWEIDQDIMVNDLSTCNPRFENPLSSESNASSGEVSLSDGLSILRMIEKDMCMYQMPFYHIERHDGMLAPFVHLDRKWYRGALSVFYWLLSRPWWERLWTLQEAIIPSCEPTVCVGRETLPLRCLLSVGPWLVKHLVPRHSCLKLMIPWGGPVTKLGTTFGLRLDQMSDLKQGCLSNPTGTVGFLPTLSAAQGRQATDLRDKLYGVFALATPDRTMRPDYSLSIQEVYCRATILCILPLSQPAAVALWPFSAAGPNRDGIRSWSISLHNLKDSVMQNIYHSANQTFINQHSIFSQINQTSLRLSATRIAAVQRRAPSPEDDILHQYHGTGVARIVSDWMSMFALHGLNDNSLQFWRTVFRGRDPTALGDSDQPLKFIDDAFIQKLHKWWAQGLTAMKHQRHASNGLVTTSTSPDVSGASPLMLWQGIDEDGEDDIRRLLAMDLRLAMERFVLFFTQAGDPGLGRHCLQNGDEIFVLRGIHVPVILRRHSSPGPDSAPAFDFISECYLDGWMEGRAVNSGTFWEDIVLV